MVWRNLRLIILTIEIKILMDSYSHFLLRLGQLTGPGFSVSRHALLVEFRTLINNNYRGLRSLFSFSILF